MIAVGVGARPGVLLPELERVVADALDAAGVAARAVEVLATVDRRVPDLREFGERRGWSLVGFAAEELAAQPVPHPSTAVAAAVGTPSVAEAAALRAAGPGAVLIVPKRGSSSATAAVARSA